MVGSRAQTDRRLDRSPVARRCELSEVEKMVVASKLLVKLSAVVAVVRKSNTRPIMGYEVVIDAPLSTFGYRRISAGPVLFGK